MPEILWNYIKNRNIGHNRVFIASKTHVRDTSSCPEAPAVGFGSSRCSGTIPSWNPRRRNSVRAAGTRGSVRSWTSLREDGTAPTCCSEEQLHRHHKDERRRVCCWGKNTLKQLEIEEIAAIEHRHRKRYRERGACLRARARCCKCTCARGRAEALEDAWTSRVNTKKYINKKQD